MANISVTTTINGRPIDRYISENRQFYRNTDGDIASRRAITNTLESFFKEQVNTLSYSAPYNAVNTSFTLDDLDIDNKFNTLNDLRLAVIQDKVLQTQIVTAMRNRQKEFFANSYIGTKNKKKRLEVDTSFISIADIDINVAFVSGKAQVVFRLKETSMNRFFEAASKRYSNFHIKSANEASNALLRYIDQTTRKAGSTPHYFHNLISVGREFQGNRIQSYRTTVTNITTGKNTITLNNIRSLNEYFSGLRWTQLVQSKLEETTQEWDKKVNPARKPWLKRRTGDFIKSVKVSPEDKKRLLSYRFTEYYRANERYGYQVDKQVTNAIRAVAQERLVTDFGIVRG